MKAINKKIDDMNFSEILQYLDFKFYVDDIIYNEKDIDTIKAICSRWLYDIRNKNEI